MENVSMFWMYIIAMLPVISHAFFVLALISGGLFAFALVVTFIEEQRLKTWVYAVPLSFALVFGTISGLIPNYQQLAFIVGGHWAINNEDLREMPDNVAQVVNGYLEQLNEEMVDNKDR